MAEDEPATLTAEELKNFLLGAVVVAAGFIAFKHEYRISTAVFYLLAAFLVLFVRELSQRITAHLMNGYVDLRFSQHGAVITVLAAILSVFTGLPVILLIPVWNDYWNRNYESWGYEIPVLYSKREYWIASMGIVFLLLTWFAAYLLDFHQLSQAVALFTFFQLMPFRENSFTDGVMDGAYILLHSGFVWLVFIGISVAGILLPV